jgi:hypothetical protein
MEELIGEFKILNDQFKQFKAENKDLLDQMKEFRKSIKLLKDSLLCAMQDDGQTFIEIDGYQLEIKERTKAVHDIKAIESMVEDPKLVEEYLGSIEQKRQDVSVRKAKRQKIT